MKNITKIPLKSTITTFLLVLTCTFFCCLTVQAKERISEKNFDYEWYLEKHPDLAAIVGDDKKAVYTFYKNIGQPNGWLGRVAPETLLTRNNFDYIRYAQENPDVAQALGVKRTALYNHYISTGVYEGRRGYSTSENINAKLKIYEVADQITHPLMSDPEIIKTVHDWMCLNIAYDYDNYQNDTIPDSSYSITGAMRDGRAVCQGYAETFQYFMDVLGLECELITGTAISSLGSGGHAWNRVKVDEQWYYIDVTWDDPVPDSVGRVLYDYYMTTDPTFGGDHYPD